MQVSTINRPDPFNKLEEMLRRGDEVTRQKLEAKSGGVSASGQLSGASTILPPQAADDVDQAYGAAMSLLGGSSDSGLGQHTLDPDRVAALLDL